MSIDKLIRDYAYSTGVAAGTQELVGACTPEQLARMTEARIALDQRIAALEAELAAPRDSLWPAALEAENDALRVERDDLRRQLMVDTTITIIELREENAALRAQLANTWQPVEDGSVDVERGASLWVEGATLSVTTFDEDLESELPDDLRLCRRTL